MKQLLIILFLLLNTLSIAQTKKVLLEEYCGAHCGQCPMGSYFVDSMSSLFPNLIPVSLHAYAPPDAMFFPEIDTLYDIYSNGAPLGAVDRVNTGTTPGNTAIIWTQWYNRIQQQLAVTTPLSIDISTTWNSATRNVTAQIDVNIIANMTSGDYRLLLYVTEDSVTGTGPGYDQANTYNTTPGPFFGLGNPIVGYIHRHVARAILPGAWGLSGLIPSEPQSGQNYSHTFNFTLPATVNQNRVNLIAVVHKFSSNHMSDNVLNSNEKKLIDIQTGISGSSTFEPQSFSLEQNYPNPFNPSTIIRYNIPVKNHVMLKIYNSLGREVDVLVNVVQDAGSYSVNFERSNLAAGVYYYTITAGEFVKTRKMIITK